MVPALQTRFSLQLTGLMIYLTFLSLTRARVPLIIIQTQQTFNFSQWYRFVVLEAFPSVFSNLPSKARPEDSDYKSLSL